MLWERAFFMAFCFGAMSDRCSYFGVGQVGSGSFVIFMESRFKRISPGVVLWLVASGQVAVRFFLGVGVIGMFS